MKTATDLPYYRWTPVKEYIPTCPNVEVDRQYFLLSAVLLWQRTEGDSNTSILLQEDTSKTVHIFLPPVLKWRRTGGNSNRFTLQQVDNSKIVHSSPTCPNVEADRWQQQQNCPTTARQRTEDYSNTFILLQMDTSKGVHSSPTCPNVAADSW